jgi:hypothetical protein
MELSQNQISLMSIIREQLDFWEKSNDIYSLENYNEIEKSVSNAVAQQRISDIDGIMLKEQLDNILNLIKITK